MASKPVRDWTTRDAIVTDLTIRIAAALDQARSDALEEAAVMAGRVYAEHLAGNPLVPTLDTPDSVLKAAQRLIRALAAPDKEDHDD